MTDERVEYADPPGDVLTPEEAARLLRVSVKKLATLPIPSARLGRRTRRYLREQVLAYLRGQAA